MLEDTWRTDLIEAIRAVRAHLDYLRELGVTSVEDVPTGSLSDWRSRAEVPDDRVSGSRATIASLRSLGESAEEPRIVSEPDRKLEEDERMRSPSRSRRTKTGSSEAAQPLLFGDLAPTRGSLEVTDRTLSEIRADVGECTRCKLHQSRTTIVFGEGSERARIMFVGEGPGADEDAQGRPFVGRAGQLLTRMIEAIGFRREEVYITNVVMCRPPNNRTPEPDEIATCEPFLFRKIRVIRPDVVVALGAVAAQSLLRTKAPISQIRGRFYDAHGTKVMPTYHPAFLLRAPERKREAWEDLKKVRDYVRSLPRSEGS